MRGGGFEPEKWLEMIEEMQLLPKGKLGLIKTEGIELTKILGASRRTATRKLKIDN